MRVTVAFQEERLIYDSGEVMRGDHGQRWNHGQMNQHTATPCFAPRVLMARQPNHVIGPCHSEFRRRGWIVIHVTDITVAREVVFDVVPSIAVLPLDVPEITDGRFCADVHDRHSSRYMPLVAFAPGDGLARARAFEAGFDAFVAHSEGAAGLCRELTMLLSIADELAPLSHICSTTYDGPKTAPRRDAVNNGR
jgi:hypothetical protein